MSASQIKKEAWNRLLSAWSLAKPVLRLLPLDTWDLVNIWLDGPGFLLVLDKYLERKDHIFHSIYLLLAMNFERTPSAFFHLLPIIFLILVGCTVGACLGAFHSFVASFLAVICFFAVNCIFAFAGHSVLDLGHAMDGENVSRTRTDTNLMGTLAFLGMLVCESVGQLLICFLLGGYLGIFLSLIVTLLMLGTAIVMYLVQVSYTISDERILQSAAKAEETKRMDEKDKKLAKLESTIEGLRFQSHFLIDLQKVHTQKVEELEMYRTALKRSRRAANELLRANNVLQKTLEQARKSHEEELGAKDKHYAEEFAKEKAHVEELAWHKMLANYNESVEGSSNAMAKKYADVSVTLVQRHRAALAKKDEEHAEALAKRDNEHADALAAQEKQHQNTLTKVKSEAKTAAFREAISGCRRWIRSSIEAAEKRHSEALATAVLEKDKLHEAALAEKEREWKQEFAKRCDAQVESRNRVMGYVRDGIKHNKDQHARSIAKKNQEIADLKALVDRHPEILLAEEDAEDCDDEDEGELGDDDRYETVIDDDEAESQDDEDSESQYEGDPESQTDEETDSVSEYEADDEDEEPYKVECKEKDVKVLLDGDDSEDELTHWALIGSDFEQD